MTHPSEGREARPMDHLILCGECGRKLAFEDAESVEVQAATNEPWNEVDETTAPVYMLVCAECAQAERDDDQSY